MPSLVEQIQRDACSDKVRVSTILRQMKVAAFKLKLDSVETWVDHELNGYGELDVPLYRQIPGHLRAWNPFNGWIPVTGEIVDEIGKIQISQSINSIEDLLSGGPGDNVVMEVNARLAGILDRGSRVQFGRYQWKLGRSNIVNIVDIVRNMILDWAISLERRGILGEGLGFTEEEKSLAQNSGSKITFGDNATVIGNLGQGNSSGQIVTSRDDTNSIIALLNQISPYRDELIAAGAIASNLDANLAKLAAECDKPSANKGILKEALIDLRNTVSGAAGNLIASGVVTAISTILGTPAR